MEILSIIQLKKILERVMKNKIKKQQQETLQETGEVGVIKYLCEVLLSRKMHEHTYTHMHTHTIKMKIKGESLSVIIQNLIYIIPT